jgi:hypothetical protein
MQQNDFSSPLPPIQQNFGMGNPNEMIEKELMRHKQIIRDYEKRFSEMMYNPYFRAITPLIPDLSRELIHAAFMNFVEKVNPTFPHPFKITFPMCYDFYKALAQTNEPINSLIKVVQYLANCVILAHGFRLNGNEQVSLNFILKCEEFVNMMFFSNTSHIPSTAYQNYQDDIISSLCLIGAFKVQSGEFNSARQFYLQAFNFLNMHVSEVVPSLSHRVYANLAGMSRSTSDMTHWVDNAHLLGREAGNLSNRVFLSLFYCSPSLLRDPKNKPIPPGIFIPDNQTAPENDLILFKGMLLEFDDTEQLISEAEKNRPMEQQEVFDDYINSYKMILSGCRSLVLAQIGLKEQSQNFAEKCLQLAKSMKQCAFYFEMAIGLSYAIQVLKALGLNNQISEALPILEIFRSRFPVVAEIIHILYAPPPEPFPPVNLHGNVSVKDETKGLVLKEPGFPFTNTTNFETNFL